MEVKTYSDRIIAFNKDLDFKGTLPEGISIMNPFKDDPKIIALCSQFYKKFYNDNHKRYIVMGINPGRFGGGVTGVPFTDSKRLISACNINYDEKATHEPSSVFVYEVINAFGGVEEFYSKFYITSLCPLGFTKTNERGKEINYNYYDSKELTLAVFDFILENLEKQIALGVETDVCFCFGTGKNEKFFRKLNEEKKFFKKIIALEHPRFIMQYKSKFKHLYIQKYLSVLNQVALNSSIEK